jgi:hypothetical protein
MQAQAKLEKVTIQVSATEQEYRVSSHVLQETCGNWEQAFKKACGDCERMEVDRYAFLREKIWHWMNLQSSLCVKEDEVSLHILSRYLDFLIMSSSGL